MIKLGNVTLQQKENGEWEASGTLHTTGETPQEAITKLIYMYPLFEVEIIEHFEEFMTHFGPKTDAEQVALVQRVTGEKTEGDGSRRLSQIIKNRQAVRIKITGDNNTYDT